jgi:hypothetical protein
MKTPDLKPCPFCGGEAKVWNSRVSVENQEIIYTIWRLSCTGCGCSIPSEESTYKFTENGDIVLGNDGWGKIVDAWNRRVTDAEV